MLAIMAIILIVPEKSKALEAIEIILDTIIEIKSTKNNVSFWIGVILSSSNIPTKRTAISIGKYPIPQTAKSCKKEASAKSKIELTKEVEKKEAKLSTLILPLTLLSIASQISGDTFFIRSKIALCKNGIIVAVKFNSVKKDSVKASPNIPFISIEISSYTKSNKIKSITAWPASDPYPSSLELLLFDE